VVDASGATVPVGERGRILVGNEMTVDGRGSLVATGDLGRFDADGRLFVEGREDNMIVSGGENVYPEEVETLLAEHPAVAEVAVVGVPDDEWGERLAAYVVCRDGAELTADEVRAHVRSVLARHKVPRDVVFVGALPRNATGKVLHRRLRDGAGRA
jgi:acyl-CoA synthetase (AMP-forming)/AMP-acid ligase II